MTRKEMLQNMLEMAYHNLECYSANYLGTKPREGMEAEHKEAAAKVEMLKTWLKEFYDSDMSRTREFIGTVSGWRYAKTYDGEPLAENLQFIVDTGDYWLMGDKRIFGIAQEVMNWFVSPDGKCGTYDIEKHERYNLGKPNTVKITVDGIENIRSIEWVD